VVDEVIESGLLTAADIYELVLPRRTLAHRREKEQRLSPEESDRLARVVRILARSEQALGSTEHASSWLRKSNRALAGKRPLELLGSDAGARAVEKVLGRVEHGVFS
jgi:putative toxin-antitoxin system antitoxin component (TIGR02293 family)